eukprot:2218035-Amphidinium_carterae.2
MDSRSKIGERPKFFQATFLGFWLVATLQNMLPYEAVSNQNAWVRLRQQTTGVHLWRGAVSLVIVCASEHDTNSLSILKLPLEKQLIKLLAKF